MPQAAGVGIVKGAEDIARTAATSVPTSEFLAWQHRWQKVHPNGALPPLTSPMGQALLKKDIAAGLIDPPPSDITLGNTVENAYNKNIDQPLKKKLGITGTPGENLAGGLGEFVVPSLIGDPMLKGLGLAGDATGLSGAEKIAARVAGSVPRALQQWGLMEASKPADQRAPLLPWLAQFAGMDIAMQDILPAVVKGLKSGEIKPEVAQAVKDEANRAGVPQSPQTPQIAPGAEQPPAQVETPTQATNEAPFNPALKPSDAEKIAGAAQPDQAAPGTQETPALDQAGKPTQSVGADLYRARFVNDEPFTAKISPEYGKTKRAFSDTTKDMQTTFTGRLNADHQEGIYLNRDVHNLAPDPNEQIAMTIYQDAGGDKASIQKYIDNQSPLLDEKAPGREGSTVTYRQAAQMALNLSQGADDATHDQLMPYYVEAGKHAMETGATHDVRDNYANRRWAKNEAGAVIQPRWMNTDKGTKMVSDIFDVLRHKDTMTKADRNQVENIFKANKIPKNVWTQRFSDIRSMMYEQTEASPLDSTAKVRLPYEQKTQSAYTFHAKPRVFPQTLDGVLWGMKPVTMDAGDLAGMHVDEMSMANNLRQFGDFLVKNKLGKSEGMDYKEADYKTIMAYGGKKIVAPTRLADAMKSITEVSRPSDFVKGINRFQGTIKTGITSYGLFHPYNEVKSLLASTHGGIDLLMHGGQIRDILTNQESMDELTRKWVPKGLVDPASTHDIDVAYNLTKKDGFLSKVTNFPGVKQYLQGAEKIRDWTFGNNGIPGMISYFKMIDSELKLDSWSKGHQNASAEDIDQAMRQIARYSNSNYGGMNWGALGVSPTVKNALNVGLLAPDWTASKFMLFKSALTDSSLTGSLARQNITTALIGGAIMTEAFNYICTGHFTDQNPKGHWMQVEFQPSTYWSFMPADIDDGLTLANAVRQKGLVYGSMQEISNKFAPLPRTIGDLVSQGYANKQGFGKGTLSGGKTAVEDIAPIPIGAQGDVTQLAKGNTGQSWLSRLAVGTGMAKYQGPAKGQEATGIGQQAQSQLQQLRAAGKSKAPSAQALAEANLSPLAKSYLGLSAPKRAQFMASLSPDQQSLLQQELSTYKAPAKKSKSGLTGFKGISGMKGLKKI